MFGRVNIIGICIMGAFVFSSCVKEEPLWKLAPTGGKEVVGSASMGANYDHVIFFQLSTGNSVVKELETWDLGFATGADEHHIVLNGGKAIQIYNTHDTDFTKVYTTSDIAWLWDNPNGDKDSTAVGNWLDGTNASKREVYIIDLGDKANPKYKKVQFQNVNSTSYKLLCTNIDNTIPSSEVVVNKDNTRNFTYINLSQNNVVDFEPPTLNWDLVFTKYRHIYYDMDPITPYYVTGALINTRFVTINETNTLKFEDIDLAKAAQLLLTNKADEMGFDWKFYDLNAGTYAVSATKIYILKDKDGYYYKLRFIDFYDDQGTKGTPKFVYQRL